MLFDMESVDEQSYVVTGVVLSEKEKAYSSSEVSVDENKNLFTGKKDLHVNTHVSHHKEQTIWYKCDDDGNEYAVRLLNCSADVLKGHKISLIYSKKTSELMRLVNLSTGFFWKINYQNSEEGIGARIIGYAFFLFWATILSLPIVNIMSSFHKIKYMFTKHNYPISKIGKLLAVVFVIFSIGPWVFTVIPEGSSLFQFLDSFLNSVKAIDVLIVSYSVCVISAFLFDIHLSYSDRTIAVSLDNQSNDLLLENK